MNYKPMSKFPGKERFSPDFVFQGDGISFFYTYIRKNASTSFKKLFKKMHPGLCPGETPSLGCMAQHAAVRDMSYEEIDQAFANKIFIYRDPVDRVFSVYKNKLIQQDGAEDLLRKLHTTIHREPGLLTFEDFVLEYVSLLETDRWEEVDGHLYPQAWHLLPITYNKVISIDNLYTEMQALLPAELCNEVFQTPTNSTTKGSVLLENCDSDCPAVYFQKKYNENRALPSLEQVLTPTIKAKLRKIYAEDYQIVEWSELQNVEHYPTQQEADNARKLFVLLETKKLECKVLQKENNSLVKQLEDAEQQARIREQQLEDVQQQARIREQELEQQQLKMRQQIASLHSELQGKINDFSLQVAENKRIKHSARYHAGYHVVMAGKSVTGLLKLPVALWRVMKSQKLQARQTIVSDAKSGALESEALLSPYSGNELVNLPAQIQTWQKIKVKAGQNVSVTAAVEYFNIVEEGGRKAVILFRSFDDKGNELDLPCGNIIKSETFGSYFKYLPGTQNIEQKLHQFSVPNNVCEIHFALRSFNTKGNQRVAVRNFSVDVVTESGQPVVQFTPPNQQAAEISILGWPDYPENGKPYVLGIMDEFTASCFEQDVNLILPRPDNWYALAEKYKPELIFIESAWKGNQGSWQYRVAEYANQPGNEVAQLCHYAHAKGIPTIFWNKEDPVHHEKFMCTAKLVRHIFTTDADMKPSYQVKIQNSSVHALPFAAQPILHKPAVLAGRKQRSCFAGSWYGERHAERGQAMRWLLQAANRNGLDIYDRNHGTGSFSYPDEFQEAIRGSLPYKELCEEYRRYRVFLNVNSVTESPTMFSRRIFEILASGTPVVSTYSEGIANMFSSDSVWMVNSPEEAEEAIKTLMTDDDEWRRRSLAGVREVFSRHTYAHRFNDIFERLGMEYRIKLEPEVVLIAQARSTQELRGLNEFAKKQRYRRFRLGIECSQALFQLAGQLSDNIVMLPSGERIAWLAGCDDHDLAGWISPVAHYGEHYLQDLINAKLYAPDANGWAKAQGADIFDYGAEVLLAASLWESQVFVKEFVKEAAIATVSVNDLRVYLADNEQFTLPRGM